MSGHVPKEIHWRFDHYELIGNKGLIDFNDEKIPYHQEHSPSMASSHTPHTKWTSLLMEIIFPIASFLVILYIGALFISRYVKKKARSKENVAKKNGDFQSIWSYDGKIAFEDIIEATENFDIKYCIGTGAYGSVYRAQLPNGKIVALKKLHKRESENPTFDNSFRNEVKMLTEIRHRNIVKLHGFCLHNRIMFLVYQYMERGSLFCVLRNDAEAEELTWSKRVNIIKEIANALSYMHHDCAPPIIHRDITTNNVLLNSEMDAFVSDFGTARFLDPDSSNQTLLVGTYGYVAPGEFFYISLDSIINMDIFLAR